jgi:hypothetical protein
MAMALDNGRLRWIEAGGGKRESAADTAEMKAAKAAASLGGGGGTTNRNAAQPTDDREKELEAAREAFKQNKDEAAFMRVWTKGQPQTWNDWLAQQQKQG